MFFNIHSTIDPSDLLANLQKRRQFLKKVCALPSMLSILAFGGIRFFVIALLNHPGLAPNSHPRGRCQHRHRQGYRHYFRPYTTRVGGGVLQVFVLFFSYFFISWKLQCIIFWEKFGVLNLRHRPSGPEVLVACLGDGPISCKLEASSLLWEKHIRAEWEDWGVVNITFIAFPSKLLSHPPPQV